MYEHSVGRGVPGAASLRPRPAATALALLSAGAAAIHFAVAGDHFREWWVFGAFFVASGIAQLAWAVLVVSSASRVLVWCGVLGSAAIVTLWVVTRTAGPLVGPDAHTPEAVGVPDAVASGLELAIILIGVSVGTARLSSRKLPWIVGGITVALTTLALLSAVGAAGVIPPLD